jgi:hypothetical protein
LITNSDKVIMFNTSVNNDGAWNAYCALSSVDEATAISSANNTRVHGVPFPGNDITGSGITAVPSAMSVQVMNPGALQTTTGIFAGVVVPTQLALAGRNETWDDLVTQVISYMRPRLMSAGKLALRGVQADAYPLNMAALANFEHVSDGGADGQNKTWISDLGIYPAGFTPIVFVNESKQQMNYLVTVEWRVRFDIGNPAVATHVDHGVSSDQSWSSAISNMAARGHGMIDIADRVADVGQSIGGLAQSAVNSRGLRAIGGYAARMMGNTPQLMLT